MATIKVALKFTADNDDDDDEEGEAAANLNPLIVQVAVVLRGRKLLINMRPQS